MVAPMATDFRNSLPAGFYVIIISPVDTMKLMKSGVKDGDSMVFGLKSIYSRHLLVGQQRDIFWCEQCTVPASPVNEYGCLRNGEQDNTSSKTWSQTAAASMSWSLKMLSRYYIMRYGHV